MIISHPTTAQWLTIVKGSQEGVSVARVSWESTVKGKAASRGVSLQKRSSAMVSIGQDFAKMEVKEGRATGSLPWGEWSVFPYIIEHKGTDYARVNTIEGTITTEYVIDGQVSTREEFASHLTPSAQRAMGKRPVGGTLTLKIDNIVSIG